MLELVPSADRRRTGMDLIIVGAFRRTIFLLLLELELIFGEEAPDMEVAAVGCLCNDTCVGLAKDDVRLNKYE